MLVVGEFVDVDDNVSVVDDNVWPVADETSIAVVVVVVLATPLDGETLGLPEVDGKGMVDRTTERNVSGVRSVVILITRLLLPISRSPT